jgi:tetraacyldisaccharide 4'-kinase
VYEPSWWYQSRPGLIQRGLQPLARVYGAVAVRRYRAVMPYRSPLPVICVGNFTAGGTGKTPLTQYIAARLMAAGLKPALLTRGYGGRVRGPHWVDAARDRAVEVGDEPLLLARSAAVLVARARDVGARSIEQWGGAGQTGFTHIVMDDGLQNPSLAKTLTIAIVDARRGIGNGHVMPAGPLRAPLGFQLELADAIVINHGFGDIDASRRLSVVGLLRGFEGPVLDASIAPSGDIVALRGATVVAFAGIGNPAHFFQMLGDLGAHVVQAFPFPDHHAFGTRDAETLLEAATRQGAMLVTTEKDHVRLVGPGLDGLRGKATSIPIRMIFNGDDAKRLDALLMAPNQV